MSENGEIYTAGKNFTLPGTDSTDKFHLCRQMKDRTGSVGNLAT